MRLPKYLHIKKASVIAFLFVLSSSYAFGADIGVQGWRNAKFGMSLSDFQTIYPCYSQGTPESTICNAKSPVTILGGTLNLAGEFSAGRLYGITLFSPTVACRKGGGGCLDGSAYSEFMLEITQQYGAPAFIVQIPSSEGMLYSVMWRLPDRSGVSIRFTLNQTVDGDQTHWVVDYWSSDKPGLRP
jgi:hypothetical protein